MTWLWIIPIVVFVLAAIIGWKRGFIKMLISLIAVIFAVALTWIFTPMVKDLIANNTSLDESMSKKIEESVLKEAETDEAVDAFVDHFPLPESVKDTIRNQIEERTGEMTKREALGLLLANVILTALVAIALFIIFMILIVLIGKLLDLINRLPGFKQVNGFFGMILALAEAFVFLDLCLLLLVPLSGTGIGEYIVGEIHKSKILTWFYENNLLMYLFSIAKQKLFG